MSDFKVICFKHSYDRVYFVYHAPDWWQDFEGRHLHGTQHLRFLGWHNLEVLAVPHRDPEDLYAPLFESW